MYVISLYTQFTQDVHFGNVSLKNVCINNPQAQLSWKVELWMRNETFYSSDTLGVMM
jgi:hypothetical protein